MSKEQSRLPPTPRSCSSPVRMEKSGSCSSRNSDSPIHWETLTGSDSQKIKKIRPSSWDMSDDELPVSPEKGNLKSHIYSSESCSNRRSVTAEINELKKQFFHSAVLETESEIEDLREKLEMSLRNDRRQTPARVRRRTKSSSSSSTIMDITGQNSPKREEEFIPSETIIDNMENISPFLELDSKFYLDNFFAELRHKRISKLETTVVIANERDEEDFQEIALDDSDELVNLSDAGYYNRTFRKLSQILEVEENKKDSDKDAEECSEKTDLFLRFSRKSEDSDYSPLQTARSKKDEKLFENLKKNEYKFKSSSVRLENTKKDKNTRTCFSERRGKDMANEFGDEVISLTAKTGTIHLNTPKYEDVKKDNSVFHQTLDDDDDDDIVNWTLIENLKLDLMKSSENPNSGKNSTRERNSGSGSRKSTKSECLQSPKFKINLGKDSARSLKVEDIKTPNSIGKNTAACSDRSIKNKKSNCFSAEQEAEKNLLIDIKSLSLGSRTSNRSLELQDILLDQGINTSRYSQRSNYVNEATDQVESSNRTDLPYGFNHSDQSSRSVNSKSSRSSRSYRIFSSRANESRMSSQRSDQFESLERLESRKSSPGSPRTELELLRHPNPHRMEKTFDHSIRSKESMKTTPKGIQTASVKNSSSRTEDSHVESEDNFEGFDSSQNTPGLGASEWIDVEKMEVISSNRLEKFLKSQSSSRSEIILSESLYKTSPNNSEEDLGQSCKSSSRKSVIIEPSDNLDHVNSNKSTKNKSRLDSCTSEERMLFNIPLNNERNYEVKTSDRSTERSGVNEDSEETGRFKSDSDSDRRLSVINEASFENIESNPPESPEKSKEASIANNEEADEEKTCKSHPVSQRSAAEEPPNESKAKTEPGGLWNDLIETFGEDQNRPFNWQNNFLGFLNHNQKDSQRTEKGPSSPGTKNIRFFDFESEGKEDKNDFILSGRLVKDIVRSPQNSEKMSSAKKGSLEKKEEFVKNLDLGLENNLMEKMKNDNDVQNFYYFEVEKTGNFGIGEFGDVKCWNLGVSHALEEGKPKGDGDGILSQHHLVSPILNQDNTQKDSKIMRQPWTNFEDVRNSSSKIQKSFPANDNLNLIPFFHALKQSKSDNCINAVEFRHYATVDFSAGNNSKSNITQKPLVEITGKRKRKAVTYTSSVQYSSSECESDETEYMDLALEGVRRSASLTDIAAQLRKSGNEKLQSNENLYNSRSGLFEKTGKGAQDKGSTNLNIFLARKKKEDKAGTKSNWLTIRQSRGKKSHRENKKSKSRLKSVIKTDSKDYLSFRSRHSIPVLNLRNSNCFQNFYKRVIGAFCLTSNSSLSTSK